MATVSTPASVSHAASSASPLAVVRERLLRHLDRAVGLDDPAAGHDGVAVDVEPGDLVAYLFHCFTSS